MWKKRLALISTVILAVGAVSMVAVAQDERTDDEGKVHRHGVGALWARGTGAADLDVDHARVGIRLVGDITITGPADLDVRIDGASRRAAESDGGGTVIVLIDFDGTIGIHGHDFTVDADGEIGIRGRGSGSFTLVGEGWWKTLHRRGTWTGAALQLGD